MIMGMEGMGEWRREARGGSGGNVGRREEEEEVKDGRVESREGRGIEMEGKALRKKVENGR